jgi:hypothetical protein
MDQADPLIAPDHVIHWKICKATYLEQRPPVIDGWLFVGGTWDTAMYYKDNKCILGYRGTNLFSGGDIWNDILLTFQLKGCPPKADVQKNLLRKFFMTTQIPVQLTGHSLGGATARCVADEFNINIVTFNAAAPPNGVIKTKPSPRETNYHIYGDAISAWMSPNVMRIDKGFSYHSIGQKDIESKPVSVVAAIAGANDTKVGLAFFAYTLTLIAKAHSLDAFSASGKPGVVMPAKSEYEMMEMWHVHFPKTMNMAVGAALAYTGTKDAFQEKDANVGSVFAGAVESAVTGLLNTVGLGRFPEFK